jgi:hypothetical protein
VPDLLDRIRQEISMRLAELRPLVDEHARLDAALQVLGEAPKRVRVPPTKGSAPQTTSQAPKTPAKRRKRAPRGANREAVLRAARERPGATSAELAAVSKVEPNTLNALLARLVKAGELQKRALPTGRTGYAPSDTPPPESA